jgi:hypothetical protein
LEAKCFRSGAAVCRLPTVWLAWIRRASPIVAWLVGWHLAGSVDQAMELGEVCSFRYSSMGYSGASFWLSLVLQLMLDQMMILSHWHVRWKRMTAIGCVAFVLVLVDLWLHVVLRGVLATSWRCLSMEVSVASTYAPMATKVRAALIGCIFWTKRHLKCPNLLSLEGQESAAVIQVVYSTLSRCLFQSLIKRR